LCHTDQLLYLNEAVFPFLQLLYKNLRRQKVKECRFQEFIELQEALIVSQHLIYQMIYICMYIFLGNLSEAA